MYNIDYHFIMQLNNNVILTLTEQSSYPVIVHT